MKADKSLKQVWEWRDAIYKESKDKSVHGIALTIRKRAAALRRSGRLHLRKNYSNDEAGGQKGWSEKVVRKLPPTC